MPKFNANLTMLFTDVDFLDRFERAAKAGFKGIEYLFPYDHDKNLLAEKLKKNGLTQVLFNMPPGNWAAGERGLACLPDRVGEFQDSVGKAIEYAKVLDCKLINCMAGKTPAGVAPEKVQETIVANFKFAAKEMKKVGVTPLIEAINNKDMPGYHVNTSKQALALLDAVGPDAAFQYDIYHMQRMEGELCNTIKANLARIPHMQLADLPGRHEPGTGEINYDFLFKFLDEIGYKGWIGCEYIPAAATEAGLGWFKAYK